MDFCPSFLPSLLEISTKTESEMFIKKCNYLVTMAKTKTLQASCKVLLAHEINMQSGILLVEYYVISFDCFSFRCFLLNWFSYWTQYFCFSSYSS